MSEPTPEQDARVRRLLADARHDEPVPADVVARLDGVLADLRAEHGAPQPGDAVPPPEVVDLTARRRRLRAASGLVAAAAVVVGGVVFVQQLQQSSGGDASTAGGASQERAASDAEDSSAVSPAVRRAYAAARVPRLRPGHLAGDVARVRRLAVAGTGNGPRAMARAVDACAPAGAGPGSRLPVRYDGVPAVLVLRPIDGGRQVVDLYACGGTVPLRSVDLPAR